MASRCAATSSRSTMGRRAEILGQSSRVRQDRARSGAPSVRRWNTARLARPLPCRRRRGPHGAGRSASARPGGPRRGSPPAPRSAPRHPRALPHPRRRTLQAWPPERPSRRHPAPLLSRSMRGKARTPYGFARSRPSALRARRTNGRRAPCPSAGGCARASPFRSRAPPRHGRARRTAPSGRETAAARRPLRSRAGPSPAPARRSARSGPARPAVPPCRRSAPAARRRDRRRSRPRAHGRATVSSAATFQPSASGRRDSSSAAARRSPRPGERSETASRMFVLPAPFGPKIATGRPSSSSRVGGANGNATAAGGRGSVRPWSLPPPGRVWRGQTRIGITT